MSLLVDADGKECLSFNARRSLLRVSRNQDARAAVMDSVRNAERREYGYAADDVDALDRRLASRLAHEGVPWSPPARGPISDNARVSESGALSGADTDVCAGGESSGENLDAASILIHEPKASTPSPLDLILGRLARYGPAHMRAELMGKFLIAQVGNFKGRSIAALGRKLRDCGTWLVFRDYGELIGPPRLHAASFCQQFRLCPFCAIRRSAKHLRAYSPKVLTVVNHQGLTPYLLTLTICNGEDLVERLDHLLEAWRHVLARIRRNKSSSSRDQGSHFAKLDGGIYSVEIKRGRTSGGWHPHLHAVVLCDVAPDAEALSREWHGITGDSHIVDLRPLHCSELLDGSEGEHVVEALAGDLAEVLKYPLKFADMSVEDNWHAHQIAHGTKLMGTFGSMRGVTVDPSLLDSPIDAADLPYIQYVARYLDGGEYDLATTPDAPWSALADVQS